MEFFFVFCILPNLFYLLGQNFIKCYSLNLIENFFNAKSNFLQILQNSLICTTLLWFRYLEPDPNFGMWIRIHLFYNGKRFREKFAKLFLRNKLFQNQNLLLCTILESKFHKNVFSHKKWFDEIEWNFGPKFFCQISRNGTKRSQNFQLSEMFKIYFIFMALSLNSDTFLIAKMRCEVFF